MSFSTARQTARLFSTSLRSCNAANHLLKEASEATAYGSFKTFAEYREFIIKKDPESLKARFNIMVSSGKPEPCPESEAENKFFGDDARKVAYN